MRSPIDDHSFQHGLAPLRRTTIGSVLFLAAVVSGIPAHADPPPTGGSSTAPKPAPCDSTVRSWSTRGFSFYLDEDNLQKFGTLTDRNYTLGTGFQWAGREHHVFQDGAFTVFDATLGRVGYLFGRDGKLGAPWVTQPTYWTRRLEAGAFTPESIGVSRLQPDDRPWAFLLGWTVTRTDARVEESTARVKMWNSEMTVGTIGSPVGKVVQRSIHAAARTLSSSRTPLDPQGWGNQIMNSRFGVPTGRFKLEYASLPWIGRVRPQESLKEVLDRAPRWAEAGWRASGEVGYYTDLSAGLQGRLGWIHSNSWERSANLDATVGRGSDLHDRIRALPPCQRLLSHAELYAFGSADGYLYAVNALLEGYGHFWSKDVMSFSQMEKATVNGQVGIAFGWQSVDRDDHRHALQLRCVPYAFHTREFRGPRARAHVWGGYQFVMSETLPL